MNEVFVTGENKHLFDIPFRQSMKMQGKTRTYKKWNSMRHRCINDNNAAYANYGGRGVGICERWLDYFCFVEDMGDAPEGKELDRINNDLGYSKSNCRWTSTAINCANKRRSRKSEYPRGVSKRGDRYLSYISIFGKQYSLGLFDTAEAARKERLKIEVEWYGFSINYSDKPDL